MSSSTAQTGPSNASAAQGQPSSTVAALLTWLIPGAGHFYLGRLKTAAIGFVCIQGMYLLGVILSKGMFLQILPPELRGRFAAALTPEAGNLGALLLHVRQYGYGGPDPEAFPSTLHLGVALTAAAGILNLILCSRAHFDARVQGGPAGSTGAARLDDETAAIHPGTAALFGWLLPGAGHFAQGRRARGVVAFLLLVSLFVLGCVLADATNLDRTRHFYYWAGQALLGPLAFAAEFISGHGLMTQEVRYADAGVVLASIAGMLNVLLLLDVYGYSDAKRFHQPVATDADEAQPDAARGPFDAEASRT